MRFLDRQAELELLQDHLSRPGAGLFVLYGRRRIGKTRLLEAVLKDTARAVYHVATRSTVAEEMARLSRTLAEGWGVPLLCTQPLGSSAALVAFLEGIEGPAVLALDEFPFLVESDPALPGLLQAAWDRRLSRSELKLIVCGSSIGMMEQTFFSRAAPLHGRRTGQLRLGPIPPRYLSEAFAWSTPRLIELAATFGGVPGYLTRLDPSLDLLGNLASRVLTLGEPLYEELPFLLREELREPRVYHAILASVAAGARKFGEISSKVGLDGANVSRYLATLGELGLIEREVPVTEARPEKSRKGLYRIADPFVATWFRFVHPFRDRLERGRVEEVVEREVAPHLHDFLSHAVEPVLRELFLAPPLADRVGFEVAHAGRHWSRTAEFDLVLMDAERRRALVAEIEWSGEVSPRELDHLRARIEAEPALAGIECRAALVSRAGFRGRRRDVGEDLLVDLSSMDLGPPRCR